MIQTKKDLAEYIAADNSWYQPKSRKMRMIDAFTSAPYYVLKQYLTYLRKYEYYLNNSKGSRRNTYLAIYYERKKNRLGEKLGIEIGPNCFGKGLSIWHAGSIVVNPNVRAGEYCVLHGANCIGNNGKTKHHPVLGDRVELGFGAVIIGGVSVASNTVIGANAVVNRSIEDEGCTYVGVPAKKVRKESETPQASRNTAEYRKS